MHSQGTKVTKDQQSQMTYNPYNIKDYEKVKAEQIKDMARGLGSNIGSEAQQKAQDKREKEKKYAD